jgi:hypothetical protein
VDKVVPVVETALGLCWEYRGVRLSAGYELVNWFGVFEGIDFVDDVHPGRITRRSTDLGLEGFFFRAEVSF